MAFSLRKLLAVAFLIAQCSAAAHAVAHGPAPGDDHPDHDPAEQLECAVCAPGNSPSEFIAPAAGGPAVFGSPRPVCAGARRAGIANSGVEEGYRPPSRAPPKPETDL